MPSVEVVGVYEVEADDPCSLVELIVHDVDGPFDIGAITQEDRALAASERQVPYAEKLLDSNGEAVLHDFWDGPVNPSVGRGKMRLAFFFHYLDPAFPLTRRSAMSLWAKRSLVRRGSVTRIGAP